MRPGSRYNLQLPNPDLLSPALNCSDCFTQLVVSKSKVSSEIQGKLLAVNLVE